MKLDQFLKWIGWVSTGGEAKYLIQSGKVRVNDLIEIRRGRQLKTGDRIVFGNDQAVMTDNGPSTT
nr:RNA-binding S4 domain-containing protein [Prochlorococcus sp. MIT 1341]